VDVERLELVYSTVVEDLSSRSAIAGAASAVLIVTVLGLWWLWVGRILRFRRSRQHLILVTGSRGKSSTVRLLHAVFGACGSAAYAKTTGSAAAELDTDGVERRTRRFGQISVLEMLATMNRAKESVPTPTCMVLECMAVKPELIGLIAQRMTAPDIVIITNCQVDHLEDQGSSRSEIASSLSEAIIPDAAVFSGESDPAAREVLRNCAERQGASITFVDGNHGSSEFRALAPHVHPQNFDLVLAVAQYLGIEASLAIEAMAKATREPHEYEVWERAVDGVALQYLDLGSINDAESLRSAIQRQQVPTNGAAIGLLVGRWDRPLRSLEFAGALSQDVVQGVIVSGGPVHAIRKVLIGEGWDRNRVRIVANGTWWPGHWKRVVVGLIRRLSPDAHNAQILSLENQHQPLADEMRRFFHGGVQSHSSLANSGPHGD